MSFVAGARPDDVMREYIRRLRQGEQVALPPEEALGEWLPLARLLQKHTEGCDPTILETVVTALCHQSAELQRLLQQPQAQDLRADSEVREVEDVPPLPPESQLEPEIGAEAFPSLDAFIAYSRGASPEAFEEFHTLAGLWVWSTVAARRVYLPLQLKRIYPNLMLVFVARPTLFAKSTTAHMARQVLQAAELDWLLLPDRITPQKMLMDMAGSSLPPGYEALPSDQQERVRMRLAMAGQRGWYYDEFGKFVRAMLQPRSVMADFVELLLTLDNCPMRYEHATILRHCERIEQPALTLLASMTPASIRPYATPGSELWHDGFLARFAFAVAPQSTFTLATFLPEERTVPTALVSRLQRFHERLGLPELQVEERDAAGAARATPLIRRGPLPERACTISPEAYRAYDRYRYGLRVLLAQARSPDLDGSYGRLPELALRIAVLCAAVDHDFRIDLPQWARAQDIVETCRRSLHRLYAQMRSMDQEEESLEDHVLRFLQTHANANEGVTIRQLQREGPLLLRSAGAARLKEALQTLVQAGEVQIQHAGGRVLYRPGPARS